MKALELTMVLEQGLEFVESLDEEAYRRPQEELGLASIGDHYRHHLDYVGTFLRGIQEGTVDYDDRRRDVGVATCQQEARRETERLLKEISSLPSGEEPLEVVQQVVDGKPPQRWPSTVGREISFVITHGVHHFAMMAIAARALGVRPPATLGVMPSTIAYQRTIRAAGE